MKPDIEKQFAELGLLYPLARDCSSNKPSKPDKAPAPDAPENVGFSDENA